MLQAPAVLSTGRFSTANAVLAKSFLPMRDRPP